ncbi:MAG: hypothetical protein WAN86_14265 [Hyphomicrobiaceae bacterium]
MALTLALGQILGHSTSAQTSDRPTIAVARTIAAQPSAQVALPIRVGRVPPGSFVRVRGLPATVSLSVGHAIAPGTWAVPLNTLPGLTMVVPATAAGSAEVVVTLVSSDGSVLVETRFTFVISPPPTAPPSSPYDRQRAMQYLQKGKQQSAQGLVAPARQLYERAADLGLAEAAMALAATYDAAELDQPHLLGIQPDAKEARRWYERARALGAPEAGQRLRRLGRE